MQFALGARSARLDHVSEALTALLCTYCGFPFDAVNAVVIAGAQQVVYVVIGGCARLLLMITGPPARLAVTYPPDTQAGDNTDVGRLADRRERSNGRAATT